MTVIRPGSRGRIAHALVICALASGAAKAQYAGAQPVPADLKAGWDTITADECKEWLKFLSGPETRGRGTGQPGFQKAADYVADHFKKFGLKPAGDNGTYFQEVPFTRFRPKPGAGTLVSSDGTKLNGGLNVLAAASAGDASGELVIVRARGDKAALPNGTDLSGKIVLLMSQDAPAAFRRALNAASPVAVISVVDKLSQVSWGVIFGQNADVRMGAARAEATPELAKKIAAAVGLSDSDLQPGPDGTAVVSGVGKSVTLHTELQVENVFAPNVVGILEGSDPTLKAQLVGIGAHLDHLGDHNGLIYPGADDDGSGTTALLALAHALTSDTVKPKRSILFMNFCGEEMGLIGSGWYSDHPKYPHDTMICELQMDMVGRNADNETEKPPDSVQMIHLVGSKRISTELDAAVQDANKYLNFTFSYNAEDVYSRSDHYNFAKHGIPIAFLFDGFHPDYHRPTDTIEKIDWNKLTNSAKLYYVVAMRSANRDAPYKKDVSGGGR